jgi:pimeloyl-ACP methyl ester carboxylesterase
MSEPETQSYRGYGDIPLALHVMGEGAPVIMLHGLFSDARMNWIRFGHAQRLVDNGYRVFMPDLRAHGESAHPHDPADYPEDVLAHDLLALIDHLSLENYDLVGFSLGSRTSVRAIARGARPRRLVLGGMGIEGLVGWHDRASHFLEAIDKADSVKQGDPVYFAAQFIKSQKVDRVAARLLIQSIADTDPVELDRFTMPALVVCGNEDRDNGDPVALADALPQGTHRAIPGTHMGCVTKPDLGRTIADWLGPADQAAR